MVVAYFCSFLHFSVVSAEDSFVLITGFDALLAGLVIE